ncbi:hypothetical protein [Azovibrio restrictus]|uniref:hypothetical protein n=1 Tax=Azovibrio restrictus TaxID=146938 RepID=UPI0026ECDC3F|nr:hypothetical protein [Azovibrio restrictus]MDD3484856.1 hypothetical protein [Azovibrio restrictus]
MKTFYLLLTALFIALAGCSKDPVVADLEAFHALDKAEGMTTTIAKSRNLQQQLRLAREPEEQVKLFKELASNMKGYTQALDSFEARSPEVKAMVDNAKRGLNMVIEACELAGPAITAADQVKLNAAMKLMNDGAQLVNGLQKDYVRLAKEKNFKPSR